MKDIEEEKSHITLKLRQTLNYIKYNNKYKYIEPEKDNDIEFIKELDLIKHTEIESSCIIDFSEYKRRLDNIINKQDNILAIIELLPPPIFDTEVVIKQSLMDNEYSLLSNLSSGERQNLNNISSVIYHLQNINSTISDSNIIKYKHINLLFEEIELYFHPEFQRLYVKKLLEQISRAKLDNIYSINICFVTHSPFILSDIPKENVLFLEQGKPKRCMEEDTFGANIYDLLHDSFFLKEYTGSFAIEKIGNLIKEVSQTSTETRKKDIECIEKKIKFIGEPFIRTQLYTSLYNNIEDKNKFRIVELEVELEELKKKINNDKYTL
ncbi:hypothetical protein [Dysgonomonas sp. HGC4]|uniref:hypothetical protein n=1 Tax=Dysgonomonas sp. HGC4 TaxID=1658009 RepID=UPI00067FCC61|nr:hypothetical protein [Dysgonomonas sp. HGC4]